MTAECAAVEHQDGEPFRGGIDRSREAGRPSAYNGHVIKTLRINWPDQTDAAGELGLAGITQQLSARTQNDWQLTGVDVKTFDQRLRLRIGLRIEPLMRVTIALEKALQPKHVAVLGASDDHRSTGSALEETDATQDEGAHDPLSELGLRDQQGPQLLRGDNEGFDRRLRVSIDQGRSARQLRQFAHECARAVGDDRLAPAQLVVLRDVHRSSQDDRQAVALLADLGERFPGAVGAKLAKPPHPLDLHCLEHREHLVSSRVDDGWCRERHDSSHSLPGTVCDTQQHQAVLVKFPLHPERATMSPAA